MHSIFLIFLLQSFHYAFAKIPALKKFPVRDDQGTPLPATIPSSVAPTTPPNEVATTTSTTEAAAAFVTSFSAASTANLAVYFGHSTNNAGTSISPLCDDPTISIVIIGFVRGFNGPNAPSVDFGKRCSFPNGDLGLCQNFAVDIWKCKEMGKKIFVSIGGSKSQTTFGSEEEAVQQAEVIWNVFGDGLPGNPLGDRRPFGSMSVDGFDIDLENGPGDYYDAFSLALRSFFPQPRGTHYISSAPLCANRTSLLPTTFYATSDFLFPRFYNAKACNLNNPRGFPGSWARWTNFAKGLWTEYEGDRVVGGMELGGKWPKVFVGALSFENRVSGFAGGMGLRAGVVEARQVVGCEGMGGGGSGGPGAAIGEGEEEGDSVLGGVMLWDGTYGQRWSNYLGLTYNEVAKDGLQTELVCPP